MCSMLYIGYKSQVRTVQPSLRPVHGHTWTSSDANLKISFVEPKKIIKLWYDLPVIWFYCFSVCVYMFIFRMFSSCLFYSFVFYVCLCCVLSCILFLCCLTWRNKEWLFFMHSRLICGCERSSVSHYTSYTPSLLWSELLLVFMLLW